MGVGGQGAAERERTVGDEVLRLAAPAEAELLELRQHERREVVVDDCGVDVRGAAAGLRPELPRDQPHLGECTDVVAVVARHHLLVGAGALRGARDDRRRACQVGRALRTGHHHRDRAVALLAAVEQPQRVDDPARRLVLVEGDRPLVEVRGGVGGRVLAEGDRHPAEVRTGGAVLVHVAPRRHCHPGGRRRQPERHVPAVVDVLCSGAELAARDPAAEAAAGALVEGAVADDDVGDAGRHRERRLLHGGAGRSAAVVDAAEEGQLPHAEGASDLDLGAAVGGERHQSAHIAGRHPGVVECSTHRLDRQLQLGAARVLGELGRADAGDRRLPREAAHDAPPRLTRTTPVTWSPSELAPRTATSTSSPSTAETAPVSVIRSPT